MTGRPHCLYPDACRAKGPRYCPSCWGKACCARFHADPALCRAHGARGAAQLRALHADPAWHAANTERSRASSKAFCQRRDAKKMRALGVPDGAEDDYRRARRAGFSKDEAAAMARAHVAVVAAREARI